MNKLSIFNYLFNDDVICDVCRKRFYLNHRYIKIKDIKVESFYLYDEGFMEAILQYKQCYDEYLYDVFAYKIKKYIRYKYYGYTIVLAPSSKDMLNERGFNHLYQMCKIIGLPIVELFDKNDNYAQLNKSFKEREEVKNHIILKNDIKIPNKILLVDDILTSGSTLYSMYQLLNKKVKNIKTLTFSYNNVWQK